MAPKRSFLREIGETSSIIFFHQTAQWTSILGIRRCPWASSTTQYAKSDFWRCLGSFVLPTPCFPALAGGKFLRSAMEADMGGAAASPVSRPPVRCYNGLFLPEKPIAFSNTSIRPSPQIGNSPSPRNRAHRKAKRGSSRATASPVPVHMLEMSSEAGPLVRFFSVPPQLRPHARHWGDPAS